ncbi:protein rep [Bacillus cereus]|nr:protein rep [Bacillus cereus]
MQKKQDLRKLEIEDLVDVFHKPKKINGEKLARSAWELGFVSDERAFGMAYEEILHDPSLLEKKEERKVTPIDQCGAKLHFASDRTHEYKFLYDARWCNWRFCPQCAHRLSLNRAFVLKVIMTKLVEQGYRFLFLTFTIPNVEGEDLRDALTELSDGWKRLSERKKYKHWIVGGVRKTEVTYNKKRNDYHPHLHILVCVKADYFKHKTLNENGKRIRIYPNIIDKAEWRNDWQRAVRNPRAEQIDVQAVSNTPKKLGKSVAELAKYSAKDSDMSTSRDVFKWFYLGMKGKRLFAPFGVMRENWNLFKEDPTNFKDYYEPREAVEWYYKSTFCWDFQAQDYLDYFDRLSDDEINRVQKKWLKATVKLEEGGDD